MTNSMTKLRGRIRWAGMIAIVATACIGLTSGRAASTTYTIEKGGKKWEPVSIAFGGPKADAGDSLPNPFLDYRLQVTFTGPGGKRFNVPGFFDGDGQGGPRRKCLARVVHAR